MEQQTAVVVFDIAESVFKKIETYQALEIVDSETEKDVRKARADVRQVRYAIQNRHKDLNSSLNEKKKQYKEMAESLIDRLLPTENNLDGKIKAVEEKAAAKKAEKMAIEKARLDKIQESLAFLNLTVKASQEYGFTSEQIQDRIDEINHVEVTEDIFQEFFEQATETKAQGLEFAKAYLARTQRAEEDQRVQAELEAKNKAEAERLAKIAQEQAEAQAKAKAEQEKAEARAKAERKAEAAKMAAERKALDEEKAKAEAEERARAEAEAKRLAELERREQEIEWAEHAAELDRKAEAEKAAFQGRVDRCLEIGKAWYEADYNEAHEENKRIDEERAVIAETLKSDKQKLVEFGEMLSGIEIPALVTDYGQDLAKDISRAIKDICNTISEQMAQIK